MAMKSKEIWKPIPGYEKTYSVSNLGKVRSSFTGKILKPSISHGYKIVTLVNPKKNKRVHRLVLESFYGVSDLQVNHLNGIKTDNRLENLEFTTSRLNTIHAHENGLVGCRKGSSNGHSSLTECEVKDIKSLLKTEMVNKDIAKIFNISPQTITDIKKGRTWSHVR